MADPKVPTIDQQNTDSGQSEHTEELEARLLEAEARLKRFQHREGQQRYLLKWIAVLLGLVVIVSMFVVMGHQLHNVFWGPFVLASPAFTVSLIVAPVLSVTSISIALIVGVFRKYDDGDMESMSNTALQGARLMR